MKTIFDIKTISAIIESLLTSLAILIGGGWTFWKYVLQREAYPKIQFNIDINFISIQDKQILFEVLLVLKNKGTVRHEIDKESFTLKIRYLTKDDKIIQGDLKYNFETKFPHLHEVKDVNKKRKIIHESWKNTFLDPGVKQVYSYITALPEDTLCILVKSKFNYSERKSDNYGAQKLFKVEDLKKKNAFQ